MKNFLLKIIPVTTLHTLLLHSMSTVVVKTDNKIKLTAVINALEQNEENAHTIVPGFSTYPLALLAESDENIPTVHALLYNYAVKPWTRDTFSATPLHNAARSGAYQNLYLILKRARLTVPNFNKFINQVNQVGKTALHNAIENEKYECATLLLHFGAAINKTDPTEKTALHFLCSHNFRCAPETIQQRKKMFIQLFAHGALLDLYDKQGKKPKSLLESQQPKTPEEKERQAEMLTCFNTIKPSQLVTELEKDPSLFYAHLPNDIKSIIQSLLLECANCPNPS